MRKYIVSVFALVCVLGLVNCGQEADNQMTGNEIDELSTIEGTALEIKEVIEITAD